MRHSDSALRRPTPELSAAAATACVCLCFSVLRVGLVSLGDAVPQTDPGNRRNISGHLKANIDLLMSHFKGNWCRVSGSGPSGCGRRC